MADRVSKDSVGYGEGMKSAHCSLCQHWRSPCSCEIVAGYIRPDAWCDRFKKAREKAA